MRKKKVLYGLRGQSRILESMNMTKSTTNLQEEGKEKDMEDKDLT